MHTSTYFALLVAVVASTAGLIRRATPLPSAADIARLAPDLGVTAPLPPTGMFVPIFRPIVLCDIHN
jgi:hypothetical protein